jgi:hypothetical protein
MTTTKRKRVLEKLIITEISGVDRPCQEGAFAAIMKREPILERAASSIEKSQHHFAAAIAKYNEHHDAMGRFASVAELQKRDNCTAQAAMTKARFENQVGFANYQSNATNDDFDALLEKEIAKGSPPSVAAQRVGLKYPNAAAAVIAKREKHPFEKVVDAIMQQDGCSRSEAMSRARKKEPVKYHYYQEQQG